MQKHPSLTRNVKNILCRSLQPFSKRGKRLALLHDPDVCKNFCRLLLIMLLLLCSTVKAGLYPQFTSGESDY